MSHCHSCHAPIRWVRTPAGKAMPLDRDPDPTGNVIIDGHGRGVVIGPPSLFDDPADDTTERWMPHFATCPNWTPR